MSLLSGKELDAEIHWYEAHGIGKKEFKIKRLLWLMKNPSKYVVCVNNAEYATSLETRKIYQSIPDEKAEALGQIRVVDESGEDYLYPSDRFLPVEVSSALAEAISNAA